MSLWFCFCGGGNKRDYRNEIDEIIQFNINNSSAGIKNIALQSMTTNKNMYHNKQHILEVEDFAKIILGNLNYPKDSDIYKCVVYACRLHDVYHPAQNIRDKFQFNGHVFEELESMHTTIAQYILNKIGEYEHVYVIGELILATNLKTYADSSNETEIDRMKCFVRCSDLCNFTYDFKNHSNHFTRLNNETGGLDPRSNIYFIDKFVLPQFKLLYSIKPCELFESYIRNIERNKKCWENILV